MNGLREKELPISHQRRSGHTRPISILAIVGALALLNRCFRSAEPAAYALCSPRGTTNVYTVDANDTKVQCLVVRDERFVHTGTYGENPENPEPLEKLIIAPVRRVA